LSCAHSVSCPTLAFLPDYKQTRTAITRDIRAPPSLQFGSLARVLFFSQQCMRILCSSHMRGHEACAVSRNCIRTHQLVRACAPPSAFTIAVVYASTVWDDRENDPRPWCGVQCGVRRYAELVAYKNRHGHCRVSQLGKYRKLGVWVAVQRVRLRKNQLSDTRVRVSTTSSARWLRPLALASAAPSSSCMLATCCV
jgi:hypothetical protein